MKVKTKPKSGSLKVDPAVLKEAKLICVRDELNIYEYATEALREKNSRKNGTK